MQNPQVLIGLPTYNPIDPRTMFSFVALWDRGRKYILDLIGLHLLYIDKARNLTVEKALTYSNATHILWLDSDMIWPTDIVERLLAHKVPVVGANYFLKTPPYDIVAGMLTEGGYTRLTKLRPGCCQIPDGTLGMGATLIELDVFRQMTNAGIKKWFCSEEEGEDVYFFRCLKALNIPICLDASLTCGHITTDIIDERHHNACLK